MIMIGLMMAGIFRKYWILLAALALALSCTKEQEGAEPVARGDYDPMVHFGLETYVGADEPATKTTYAGDDKTILLNSVRYERIDWDVTTPDVVQILSEQDFTKYDKKEADYKAKKIEGRTNNSTTKEDVADTEPYDGDVKKAFYWSAIKEDRYFYAVYPSPNKMNVPNSTVDKFEIGASHTAMVEASISPNTSGAESDREQPYIKIIDTPGTSGSPASIEYLPDMTNAYMYAAAKVDGADAGYKKVPLRFKPLFSAVKLMITARDAGAQNYRLKKVELRTDLHYNDVYLRPGNPKGTALGGKFKARFGLNGNSTGDFTLIPPGSDPSEEVADTLQRLTINIPAGDRRLLEDKTVKVTFLVLPIEQKYLVVDYTFEYLEDPLADPSDPNNWKEVRRILALQDRKKIFETTDKESWYKLEKARKLYVRSGVPEIEYHFEVQSQSFLPRVWRNDCPTETVGGSNVFLAQDFYSVVSYRDSSGVLQPLKWQVTGYATSATGPFTATKPDWLDWLFLRGENGSYNPAADKAVFFDPQQTGHSEYGYANNGIDPTGDPWDKAWGYGTHMDNTKKKTNSRGFFCGYEAFENNHKGVFFNAGGTNNGTALKDWLVDKNQRITYNYCDPDGNYYYTENRGTHEAGEAYAYDLSSHDIYGNLYTLYPGFKNGDLGTTANCYVVSAPGWYRFPAVYGNAFKGGADNTAAYTGDGGTNLLGAFLDHNNAYITQPWIPGISKGNKGRDGVSLVWEDATDMIYPGASFADASRAEDLKPFYWEDPATGYGYIYFYVNQIAWSNAVIAAKSGNTIVWSWHIWCVPDPNSTLEKVTVEKSNYAYNSNPNIKNEFKYKNPVNAVVWKRVDLGQGSKEDSADYRYCYVKFSQYWRGKEIATRIVCFVQSGVKDSSGLWDAPTYQWGRKDPFRGSQTDRYTPYYDGSDKSLGYAIQNPTFLLYASSNASWHGNTRYDNLWNTNVDYYPQTFDGFVVDGTSMGRKNTPVKKTVYDPCPPGFCVPNLFAFTGFNTQGLLQEKIPHGSNLEKVTNHRNWTNLRSEDSGFIDEKFTSSFTGYEGWPYFAFLAQNDDNVSWRRKIAGEEVFFYARGRRNGGGDSTAGKMDQNQALSSPGSPISGNYWLAEPACSNSSLWSYGSVFIFSNNTSGTGTWVYPVAGASGQAKWQRTHGCYIRPMEEQ